MQWVVPIPIYYFSSVPERKTGTGSLGVGIVMLRLVAWVMAKAMAASSDRGHRGCRRHEGGTVKAGNGSDLSGLLRVG